MNQLPLVPFFDRLFVKRDETIERTKSGVIIPDSDKEKPNRGIVLQVGPDCKFAYAGQRIIFGQHHGFELLVGSEEVTVLREQDIYAGEKKPKPYSMQDRIIDQKIKQDVIRQLTPEERKKLFEEIIDNAK